MEREPPWGKMEAASAGRNMNISVIRLTLLFAALAAALAASAQTRYGIVQLGASDNGYQDASAINDAGQIAGYYVSCDDFSYQAYRANGNGSRQSLGSLGGDSGASAINRSGAVAGVAYTAGDATYRAFRCTDATGLQDLGTLGGVNSAAQGINDAGQVVGYAETGATDAKGNPITHAFRYTDGVGMVDLTPSDARSSDAYGINAAGDVAGVFYGPSTANRAFLSTVTGLTDLGTLGGPGAYPAALNDLNQVVGNSDAADGTSHAFLWSKGTMTDIGSFGGKYTFAEGINDAGEVVGFGPDAGNAYHAFLYTAATGMVDLDTLLSPEYAGWTMYDAYGINASGQIVGDAINPADGYLYGVILNPQATPEPSALAALGVGAVAILRRRRRA